MFDGIVPRSPRHLFLGEVCVRHTYHDLPVRFHQAVGRLSASQAGDDRGEFKMQKRLNVIAREILVAITSKLTCQIPNLSAKGKKG
jgi:hypothetical protein